MNTILTIGNILNKGSQFGDAKGFSILKLTELEKFRVK